MQLQRLLDFVTKEVGAYEVPNRAPDRVITNEDGSQDYGYDDFSGITHYYNQNGKYCADSIGSMDGSEEVDRDLAAVFMKQKNK